MNSVSEKGSDFIQDLGEAVRKNPLSAALIGMGVLWLFTGSRPVETAGDFVRNAGLDRIPHPAGTLLTPLVQPSDPAPTPSASVLRQ
jgi:hypothetical protein